MSAVVIVCRVQRFSTLIPPVRCSVEINGSLGSDHGISILKKNHLLLFLSQFYLHAYRLYMKGVKL